MRGLKGKRFIVGGGATGIGASLAMRLADEGAQVLVGDINLPALDALKAERDGILVQHFDLSEDGSAEKLVTRAVEAFGGLDGVAITGADLSKEIMGNDHALPDMVVAIWERTLRVNLIGHALLMRAAIPHLKTAGGGAIVSVSSAAATDGLPELPAYAASKAGLQALVRHVATLHGADKIRCNAVSPGLVETPGAMVNMTELMRERVLATLPLPRFGQPEDLAAMLAFLLSDDAAWITGQTYHVNGGMGYRD
jgi:NAD(P)-dependent dehydrogenase (short-subunit alcohol dehydrogenase family)